MAVYQALATFSPVPSPIMPMALTGGEITQFIPTNNGFYSYIGCSEKSEFTGFAAGREFVTAYTMYRKMLKFVTKGGSKSHLGAFTWLQKLLNPDGSRNEHYCAAYDSDGLPDPANCVIPYSLDEAWAKYGTDKTARAELFGCLLYISDEMFQRGAQKQNTGSNEPIHAATSAQIYADLHTETKFSIPPEHQTTDSWRNDRILPRGLTPECIDDFGEDISGCERWNRIWHCFLMMDYYKPASKVKAGLMWAVGDSKAFDQPIWWRKQKTPTDTEPHERDPGLIIEEALAESLGKNTVRQVECLVTFAGDEIEFRDYLNGLDSELEEYTQEFQNEHTVFSPCEFESIYQWTSYVGKTLNFAKLTVDVLRVQMILFDANGLDSFGERIVYSPEEVWEIKEFEDAFDEAYAAKAIFIFTMIPDSDPYTVSFEMPQGLGYLLDFDPKTGRVVDKVLQMSTSLQDQDSSARLVPPRKLPSTDLHSSTEKSTLVSDSQDPATHSQTVQFDDTPAPITEHSNLPDSMSARSLDAAPEQHTIQADAESNYKPPSVESAPDVLDPMPTPTGETIDPEVQSILDRLFGLVDGPQQDPDLARKNMAALDNHLANSQNKNGRGGAGRRGARGGGAQSRGARNSGPRRGLVEPNRRDTVRSTVLKGFGPGLTTALKMSTRMAQNHTFAKPKPRGLPGLTQFRTPYDEWQLDRLGPGNRPREKGQFLKEEYDGLNVIDDPNALIEWIHRAIKAVAPGAPAGPRSVGDRSKLYADFKKHSQEMENKTIEEAMQADREFKSGPKIVEGEYNEAIQTMPENDIEIENATMGSNSQVGPDLNVCLELLGMYVPPGPDGKHGETGSRYASKIWTSLHRTLLPSQITAVVHMLLRTCGSFPLSKAQLQDREKYEDILKRLEYYRGPATGGGFLEDSPGMGKTADSLAFFDWWSKNADHVDSDGVTCHRPAMILTPDGKVLRQWVEEINKYFPGIDLIVMKPDAEWVWNNKFGQKRFSYVKRAEVCDPQNKWPSHLDYIFNKADPKASRTIILGPYTTVRKRLVEITTVTKTQQELHGKAPWPEKWCHDPETKSFRIFDVPFWKGKLSILFGDEGHQARNDKRQLHWMVRELEAPVNWLLSATPMVNSATDIAALSRFLWKHVEPRLKADPDYPKLQQEIAIKMKNPDEAEKWKKNDIRVWRHVAENYPPTSDIQLIRLNPNILRELLRSKNIIDIHSFYHLFDSLAAIRRSSSSTLPMTGANGEKLPGLSLKDIMPPKSIKTVVLKHQTGLVSGAVDDEYSEYLIWSRKAAGEHAEIIRQFAKKSAIQNKPQGKFDATASPPPPVQPSLRRMALATASVMLARFDNVLERSFKQHSTVRTLKAFRDHSYGATHFLAMTKFSKTPLPGPARPSRIERLKRLVYGSPKLKEIMKTIKSQVIPQLGPDKNVAKSRMAKLLITEEFPLIAFFWELVLNFIHVPTQVLHSDLSETEREHVMNEFNCPPRPGDFTHLSVLVLMYTINASGVNLDADCNLVIVSTAASSTAVEVQAWSRVVRVSQKKPVYVIRLSVVNSHDEYRDSVQASKTLFVTACKSYAMENCQAMADVLNEFGRMEIEYIQESTEVGKIRKAQFDAAASSNPPADNDTEADADLRPLAPNPMTNIAIMEKDEAGKVEGGGSDAEGQQDYGFLRPDDSDEDLEEEDPESSGEEDTRVDDDADDENGLRGLRIRTADGHDYGIEGDDGEDINDGTYMQNDDPDDPENLMATEQDLADELKYEFDDLQENTRTVEKVKGSALDYEDAEMDPKRASKLLDPFMGPKGGYRGLQYGLDQTDIYYCYIATLDKTKVYEKFSVAHDEYALERALRLLHRIRYGQFEANLRVTPYIDYSAVPRLTTIRLDKAIIKQQRHQPVTAEYGIIKAMIPKKGKGGGKNSEKAKEQIPEEAAAEVVDTPLRFPDLSLRFELTSGGTERLLAAAMEYKRAKVDAAPRLAGSE